MPSLVVFIVIGTILFVILSVFFPEGIGISRHKTKDKTSINEDDENIQTQINIKYLKK